MLTVSTPPHIDANASVNRFMGDAALSLLPAVALCSYFQGFKAITLILAAVFSCLAVSALYSILPLPADKIHAPLWKRVRLFDFSAVVTGIIFSLAAPISMPLWLAASGGILSIVAGREIFGGIGMNPFNPALIGIILTQLILPVNSPSMIMSGTHTSLIGLLVGAAYLLLRGNIKIYATAGFAVSCILFAFLFTILKKTGGIEAFFNGNILLGALFLVNDPVTTPITKKGKMVFGAISGFLAVFVGVFYSVLISNMLTPLIDELLRPRRFGGTIGYEYGGYK